MKKISFLILFIAIIFMTFNRYKEVCYLKMFPTIKVEGKVKYKNERSSPDGNIVIYGFNYIYNKKSYVTRMSSLIINDKIKLNINDKCIVIVSKLNPNIAIIDNKSEINSRIKEVVMITFVFVVLLIFIIFKSDS
jgi:hypothetical protein